MAIKLGAWHLFSVYQAVGGHSWLCRPFLTVPDRGFPAVRGSTVCAKQAGGRCPGGNEKFLLNQGKSAPLLHRLDLTLLILWIALGKEATKHLAKCLDFQLQNANKVHRAFLQSQAYSRETLNYN